MSAPGRGLLRALARAALALGLACALTAVPGRAAAQAAREVQVPLDAERGILEVTPALAAELGFFADVPGFQSARLFRLEDGGLVLEVSRLEGGRLARTRERVDDARLAAFRGDLGTRLAARGGRAGLDRSGRSGLVLAETLLGVGFYGWMVPEGFGIDSDRGILASYLLTAGAGFYLPYRITRNASVSVAERNAALWGATRGLVHGALLGELIDDEDDPGFGEDSGVNPAALAALGMSLAETVVAYQLVDAADATEGEVALWGTAGDFGIPFGYGLSYLLGLFEETTCDVDVCSVEDAGGTPQGYAGTLAVSLAAPFLVHASGAGAHTTLGDARALRSFGLLGAQAVLPLARAAFESDTDENGKAVVATVLAGSAAGLWIGNRVLRDRSLSGGDGLLVLAGHVAGGLGALGVTYLLDDDSGDRNEVLYLSTSAVGSAAGALLTLRAVSPGGSARSAARGPTLEVTPGAALLPLLANRASEREIRAPLLTIRF